MTDRGGKDETLSHQLPSNMVLHLLARATELVEDLLVSLVGRALAVRERPG